MVGLLLACVLMGVAPPRTTALYGYSVAGSENERRFESMFLDIPSAQGALDAAAVIAARPHYAGSYGDQELAKYMRDKLQEYGLEASLETLTARVETVRIGRRPVIRKPNAKQNKNTDNSTVALCIPQFSANRR